MMRKLLVIFAILLCFARSRCETLTKSCTMKLMETKDEEHKRLNLLFVRGLGFPWIFMPYQHCQLRIENKSLPKLLSEHSLDSNLLHDPVIIHLYAKDFYEHNYNKILNKSFIYAGDLKIGPIETGSVHKCNRKKDQTLQTKCESQHKKTNKCKDEIYYKEKCETVTYNKHSAKIVSKNVLNYPLLHDYIKNFDGTGETKPIEFCKSTMDIVVCDTDRQRSDFRGDSTFEIKYKLNCDDISFDPSTVVILAPTPFDVSETEHTTTIFYGDSYISPEAGNKFNNSFHWMPLIKTKFALLEFMKLNRWNRVAIISDSSSASAEYERELTALFDEENVIYASRSCDVLNCDFEELLRPLIDARAKLVIVNFGEEYATEFTRQVRKMQFRTNIVWIVKGWSEDATTKAGEMGKGDVFSISLNLDDPGNNKQKLLVNFVKEQLDKYNYHEYKIYGSGDFDDNDETDYIFNNKEYRNCKHKKYMRKYEYFSKQLREKPRVFHREIARYFKDILYKETRLKATVTLYGNFGSQPVATVTILPTNRTENGILYNSQLNIRTDIGECYFQSSDYMKMCNDAEFIFFTLVISVFILMVVGILHFFQSAEISYSRMAC